MTDVAAPDPASGIVIEALSREDGKNSTVRVYPDRIEWIKQESISSTPRPKSDPPVIPLRSVASVKAKKDGPLFSRVLLRTDLGLITFRMYSPLAVEVRDVIAQLLAAGPPAYDPATAVSAPPPAASDPSEDDLVQLRQLRDDGMISAEEFEQASAQLRGS